MRIGLMFGGGDMSLDGAAAQGRRARDLGLSTFWLPHIFGHDAIATAAIVAREVDGIELGTAVVPTYPRHPVALAQQVLTASAASGGRFTLGIGLSHRVVIEDLLGLDYSKPAAHMREYLQVLVPLLRGEPAKHQGEHYRVNAQLDVPGAKPVPLLVAALGPVMLGLAGRMADGTITWMTGAATLGDHIVPRISKAAADAGRPAPRVVAGLPCVLTADVDAARAKLDKAFAMYNALPSYRAMLDREKPGASPADISLIGDEKALRQQLQRLRDAGVTDLDANLAPVEEGSLERTCAFLADEAKSAA